MSETSLKRHILSTENDQLWNEVAAERAGDLPAEPVEKPVEAPAAVVEPTPEEVKPDPLAEISAKLSEFEAKMAGRLRNVEGHIGNLTGTQKQLREMLEAGKAAAAQSNNAPTQSDIQSAVENPAEWEKLKEDWPEWAAGTEKFLELKMKNGFDAKAFETEIRKQMQGETAAIKEMIVDSALDAVLPDWKEEIKTPEFNAWLNGQPESVRALAGSDRVGDAAKMLKMYDSSKQASPVNQIVEQRKQKLESATATPRSIAKPNTTKAWEDMTPEEQWNHEKRLRAKRAGN